MAKRIPQPFFREQTKSWYVQLGGRQHPLGKDETEAYRLYHELMARKPEEIAPPPRESLLAVEVLDLFLEWASHNREPLTYEAYRRRLLCLYDAIPGDLPHADLRPYHLTRVMDAKGWGANTKNDFAAAVNRAYNWAVKQGLIDRNPVANVERPARQARELAIGPKDYAEVMAAVKEPNFRLLIEVAWETGARVQELRKIEARYLDAPAHRVVFPPSESKGKRHHRVIYLGTDRAREVVGELAAKYPTGPILRNSEGNPWTKDAINCAFCRLGKKIGRKLHLGAWRKGYATEALKAGIDTLSVAMLLGHRDGTMVSKVYGRVQNDPEHMADMASRAKRKPL